MKVWVGENLVHYYVLSRFLISRMLTVTKIPQMKVDDVTEADKLLKQCAPRAMPKPVLLLHLAPACSCTCVIQSRTGGLYDDGFVLQLKCHPMTMTGCENSSGGEEVPC